MYVRNEDVILLTQRTKTVNISLFPVHDLPIPTESSELDLHTVYGCFGNILNIKCRSDELVHIVEDIYGVSSDPRRCNFQDGDCLTEVMGEQSLTRKLCQKRSSCENIIVTRTYCRSAVTSYQRIKYKCVAGKCILLTYSFQLCIEFGKKLPQSFHKKKRPTRIMCI